MFLRAEETEQIYQKKKKKNQIYVNKIYCFWTLCNTSEYIMLLLSNTSGKANL